MRDDAIRRYIKRLHERYRGGDATEVTYRGDLEQLLKEVLGNDIDPVSEPRRNLECGAPDYVIKLGGRIVGFIETKDIGTDLDRAARTEQLQRYRKGLGNLILTDYLTFYWYRDGEFQQAAHLGEADPDKRRIKRAGETDAFATLLSMFRDAEQAAPAIADPRELADKMAARTRLLADAVTRAMDQEQREAAEHGGEIYDWSLHAQLAGFRDILLHELSRDDFVDMYAQTIAYGMFTARFNKKAGETFTREMARSRVPRSNPFLSKLFAHIDAAGLDDRVVWVVDDLARVLDRTDINAILSHFRGASRRDDPIVYFYETFLASYRPDVRERRGVYYTPGPVVDYIVRSIDRLLQRDFGLRDGLADSSTITVPRTDGSSATHHRVQILDPAAGTCTFPHAILDHVYHTYFNGMQGAWPDYARTNLLPRLHAFEVLMAPYAMGHLKLNVKLEETGCTLGNDQRVNLYLTNALEEPLDPARPPMFTQFLKEEAKAANAVKREKPVMVVTGNPPYSGESMNPSTRPVPIQPGDTYETYHRRFFQPLRARAGKRRVRGSQQRKIPQRTFIGHLLRGWDRLNGEITESYFHLDGEPLDERNPRWLNDDYVKFIRFAQWRVARTGYGVVALVTNHSYLDNPTFRGMRESLMRDFDAIYVLDMHGNTRTRETPPDGIADTNVFDIQQGVAILLAVKHRDGDPETCAVYHADLRGPRSNRAEDPEAERADAGGKYGWLASNDVTTTGWTQLAPEWPWYWFVPQNSTVDQEYKNHVSVNDIFHVHSAGIATARDRFTLHFTFQELKNRVNNFKNMDPEQARSTFSLGGDVRDWKVRYAQSDIIRIKNLDDYIYPILYRPFDHRYTVYTGRSRGFLCMPREQTMRHMRDVKNVGIITSRMTKGETFAHAFVTDTISEVICLSPRTSNNGFLYPLYCAPPEGKKSRVVSDLYDSAPGHTTPNLRNDFIADFGRAVGLEYNPSGSGDLETTFGPEDVFAYIYAILHAPSYRERYVEQLKRDFPRIPLPPDAAFFRALAEAGGTLIGLHLLRQRGETPAGFPETGEGEMDRRVDEVCYRPPTAHRPGRVFINETQYFEDVPSEVWAFQVGGHQVCDKWLKDRRGRRLSHEEITTYCRIVGALRDTLDIMRRIDATVAAHGGWPLPPTNGA